MSRAKPGDQTGQHMTDGKFVGKGFVYGLFHITERRSKSNYAATNKMPCSAAVIESANPLSRALASKSTAKYAGL